MSSNEQRSSLWFNVLIAIWLIIAIVVLIGIYWDWWVRG